MSDEKLIAAIEALEHALTFEKKAEKDEFYYNGIAKTFEVALEYAWKYLKIQIEGSGLEAPSPRDAIKQAGRIGLIDDVDLWLNCIRIRNIAVHDYLGITRNEYLDSIKKFARAVKKLRTKV